MGNMGDKLTDCLCKYVILDWDGITHDPRCQKGKDEIVCNCGHTQAQHLFTFGCIVKDAEGKRACTCDRYTQKGLRKASETQAQYIKRVLGRTT